MNLPFTELPCKGCNCSCCALQIWADSEKAPPLGCDDSGRYYITLLLQETATNPFKAAMQRDFLACPVAPLRDCWGWSLISGTADLNLITRSHMESWTSSHIHYQFIIFFTLALTTHLRILRYLSISKLINGSPLQRGMITEVLSWKITAYVLHIYTYFTLQKLFTYLRSKSPGTILDDYLKSKCVFSNPCTFRMLHRKWEHINFTLEKLRYPKTT